MATSSTDAFNTQLGNNIPLYSNNYSMVSVTTGPNFWPTEAASSSTSPASENNWDVDEEEAIKRRIYELKRQFHNGRYLIIRHLPRDATEEVCNFREKGQGRSRMLQAVVVFLLTVLLRLENVI
ncbi:uncharacterized protein LOC134778237 [Penaeus indicus]|uniref:uncharacterized protein LOC134778237 n=1 Tax=Penaeus indicus TaxID=29960 RepID=UPI00300C181C